MQTAVLSICLLILAITAGVVPCNALEPAPTVEPHRPLRILFIGNSLTFTNNLPAMLQQLSTQEDRPLLCQAVTAPYVSLRFHWYFTAARGKIRTGQWDYVILQEFSTLPVTNPAATSRYIGRFIDAVRAAKASPIIFENWTHKDRANDYATLVNTYSQIAAQTGAMIAPIGSAWHNALRDHPDLKLYRDNRHPSLAGSYLAACVLYQTIYHKSPVGLPADISRLAISTADVSTLQTIAGTAKFGDGQSTGLVKPKPPDAPVVNSPPLP